MGFLSWDCPCCDHSIRHPGAVSAVSRWMSHAVAVFPNGDRISGEYNGFGSIGSYEDAFDDNLAVYHRACWVIVGKPDFTKPSEPARDQGHFVGNYDPAEPKTLADCESLQKIAREKAEAERREAENFAQRMHDESRNDTR